MDNKKKKMRVVGIAAGFGLAAAVTAGLWGQAGKVGESQAQEQAKEAATQANFTLPSCPLCTIFKPR